MPSLGGATEWLNSAPLGPAELRRHVVLVDFWTLTCINWLRQEPYVRAWSRAYRNDGLVVIGVHTPEFSFEHEIDRVRQATTERAIDYPVAGDNDYAIWSAFDNHYWPALYFVDADGMIRDHHFGEGRYEQSERVIQRLLGVERELVSVEGLGAEAEADWDHLRTPETYLGYGRSEHFASPDGAAFDERRAYQLPDRLRVNHWALAGEWTIGRENVVLDQAGGSIAYRFRARDAHLVLFPRTRGPIPSACSSTANRRARHTAWTSPTTEPACSRTTASTSSYASTMRSASGHWRSRSSNPARGVCVHVRIARDGDIPDQPSTLWRCCSVRRRRACAGAGADPARPDAGVAIHVPPGRGAGDGAGLAGSPASGFAASTEECDAEIAVPQPCSGPRESK
jgi:SAM-dependent methyltransferase